MVILQIISAVFLGCAIVKIRKVIKSGGHSEEVNIMQMVRHFLAFGLYLLGSLIFMYFYIKYYIFIGENL